MTRNIVLYSIPFFATAMAIEGAITRRQGRSLYSRRDTLTNLALGTGSQIVHALSMGINLIGYEFIFTKLRLFDLPSDGVGMFLVAFLGVDLGYYAYHRASHRINFLWATHVVHHQSEHYNLSVALRQSWFSLYFSWVFYLPLAWIGVPTEVFVAHAGLNLVLQFWIHTQLIKRLGILEWVLNTPSHHRVHHGTNPPYIDKNYAGVLIIWDRLFGTFVEEQEPVNYGSLERFRGDPVAANLDNWKTLIRKTRTLDSAMDRLQLWIREPGWQPPQRDISAAQSWATIER